MANVAHNLHDAHSLECRRHVGRERLRRVPLEVQVVLARCYYEQVR